MKTFTLISISLFLMACSSQKNNNEKTNMSEYTGLIQKQGITSYQYGTHTLTTKDSFYALKSETVDLDKFLGETITVTAESIDGYPVDNGPVYLNVSGVNK